MRYTSDEQRKAMFARLRGGGIGSRPVWVFPQSAAEVIAGAIGGAIKTLPKKTPKKTQQAPTTHNTIPATRPKVGGGFRIQPFSLQINTNIGLPSVSGWLTAYSSAKMPNFNLLAPTLGWDPTSWTEFLFQNTIFDPNSLLRQPLTPRNMSDDQLYYQAAENTGADAPPPIHMDKLTHSTFANDVKRWIWYMSRGEFK